MKKTTLVACLALFLGILPTFAAGLEDIDNQPIIEIGKEKTPSETPPAKAPEKKGTKKDYSGLGMDEIKRLAEGGDAEAQYVFGMDCLLGGLVEKNESEGAKWLLAASRQNIPKAQAVLGNLYKEGIGVPKDYFQAIKWYRPAVDAGFLKANIGLGLMYFEGKGVSRDSVEAFVLLNLASPAIRLEPEPVSASATQALEALRKELSADQMELAKAQMNELKDKIFFSRMGK